MHSAEDLSNELKRLDRRGYKAYKDIAGRWDFSHFQLHIDHVQGDPFAAPSRVRVRVPMQVAAFPDDTYHNRSREVGLRDYLTRQFGTACRRYATRRGGSGKSGTIEIDMPGQEVIERTSVIVTEQFVEARFVVGLPAFGRKIAGGLARTLLIDEVPQIVEAALLFQRLDRSGVYRAVETAEDADVLRGVLAERGLVAFVAEGAILPRRSGVDERPMDRSEAVAFTSPERFRVEVELPNRGKISGMGIAHGISLIVGGGYHGKSTLLNAVEQGVYNHIPGDGREMVVSDPLACKIRAEDGRRIEKTAITPFISNLPYGRDTEAFSSENGSGSTSQAANIIEAIEAGASSLLIDEDTSATNFMIRDHRMQELVAKDREPITPFIDKVRQLFQERGVSTILVIGGSGDYFDVADHVISMNAYVPADVTAEARRIAEKYRSERAREGGEHFGRFIERAPVPSGIDPSRGKRDVKINIRGPRLIDFGTERIDLTGVEQLIHTGQARAISSAMVSAKRMMDGKLTLRELLDRVMDDIDQRGLDGVGGKKSGDLVRFRRLELAAALNRLRSFQVRQV
ncbi:MAG: ABC-ATPase domain-containing protein [Spirochaetaceae bacterium]|nr:ABC-ATPase domain-containing protein [Spirochaetaceae bacterium]MCF7947720.1 ABC-ATPase domain-containing protein [Spirochaetia bacterium]MCF7951853.1 ABC-ATPase domain-containing protein [Spirochaetaceae bacterium]